MVRGEGVDGEHGRQRQVQAQFLGDLAPTGDVRVFTVFDDTAGQHPRTVLAVGGMHQQDLAHLVRDDRGGTKPGGMPGRGVPICRYTRTR